MILPTEMTIGTRKLSIQMLRQMPTKGVMGTVYYNTGAIHLATHSNTTNGRYSPSRLQETFWHEITHAVLHDMGSPLFTNEKFVTAFSQRLSKAINSAKFK